MREPAISPAGRGKAEPQDSRSAIMSTGLAGNWWAVGLRAVLAFTFVAAVLLLPRPTLGALVLTFAAYVAADGVVAIVSGLCTMPRGGRWPMLIFEGTLNLTLAGAVLVWPAMATVAFVSLTSAWAIITGALLLAAARRLSLSHGRWLLALAGIVSAVWGGLAATLELSNSTPETMGWWLIGYALPFAATLFLLAGLLQRRDRDSALPVTGNAWRRD
jgi:uncharacterized membrane protein HdeD (DUF308 family)